MQRSASGPVLAVVFLKMNGDPALFRVEMPSLRGSERNTIRFVFSTVGDFYFPSLSRMT
jgi:hypothetical protein